MTTKPATRLMFRLSQRKPRRPIRPRPNLPQPTPAQSPDEAGFLTPEDPPPAAPSRRRVVQKRKARPAPRRGGGFASNW
jgi:hypothetical protein